MLKEYGVVWLFMAISILIGFGFYLIGWNLALGVVFGWGGCILCLRFYDNIKGIIWKIMKK